MEFSSNLEQIIKKRLQKSQFLLLASVAIAGVVAFIGSSSGTMYYLWAIYFVVMGALALPNINRCKKDLLDFQKNVLTVTEGKVLDVFPEKEESGKWIIFMDVEGNKDVVEFVVPVKPSVESQTTVKVFHTNILKLPVRIEMN